MASWKIKGSCEHCGLAYKGVISSANDLCPRIQCPDCHKETQNFDDEKSVDESDKAEGYACEYKECEFEIVR
jgi:hypothetical protein